MLRQRSSPRERPIESAMTAATSGPKVSSKAPALRKSHPKSWSAARADWAVEAIEERDGAAFYVQRTSPIRPMSLVRTPGFAASRPQRANGAR